MTSPHRTSEHILSELIADAVRQYAGAVGVLVRDLLAHDANTLLHRLQEIHREEAFPELRIAYLLPGGAEAAHAVGVSDDLFSEIEQAERWRNQRDLDALIVVVARGDEAKLSSLEDFWTVTSHDLKGVLIDRAMGGPAGENEVQARLWQMLADDDAVGLGQLVDYYLSLEGRDGTEFKNASSRELHRLGLLPDSSLFDHTHASAMATRLRSNREIVERLQMLTPKDRRTIKQGSRRRPAPRKRRYYRKLSTNSIVHVPSVRRRALSTTTTPSVWLKHAPGDHLPPTASRSHPKENQLPTSPPIA